MVTSRCHRNAVRRLVLAATMGFVLALTAERAPAAFGVTSGGGAYTVDTGAGLVFKVNQANGDITSIQFNGTEYQATDKNSHLISGLGTATVSAATYGNSYIKISCATSSSNAVASDLTHFLMVRNGYNNIYMATYATAEPGVGELRWITRLQSAKIPGGPIPSDIRNTTNAIESSDIFGRADGTTRSKYYGEAISRGKERAMDLTYCGATGSGIGVWMVFDQPRESASGGPFFRDIQNQCGTDQEIYNYMNSGHNQTEPWRTNVLHGPYALVFTTGGPPALPLDYSWIETGGLALPGWVSKTERGQVTGVVTGIPAGFQGVVGFENSAAQYWAVVSTNGTYASPLMKPGTYTVLLYKGELEVATNAVTVSAGVTNQLNLVSAETAPIALFKIGEWDGTPAGFLNADKIVQMHPQDTRMAAWGPATFTVGSDPISAFPMACWKDTNNPITILFNLAPNQVTNLSLRIGITCAYAGGRPKPAIGSWTPANPSPSSQPSSRSLTLGTYRGNNWLYSFNVPASALVAGENTLTLTVISGSGSLGPFLSPGCAYDAVELDIPNSGPALPLAPSGLTATNGGSAQINLAWNDLSTNEVNFLLERSLDNTNFALIAAVQSGITNYSDTGLSPATPYFYRVRAGNNSGYSAYTSVASANTAPLTLAQWQMQYFGCTNCPQALASADPDGDGAFNLAEYQAGTSPTNGLSVFRIVSAAKQGNDILLRWTTARGRTNVVQTATQLEPSTFSNLSGPIFLSGAGDGTNNYLHQGGGASAARYYRIRILP
jgi:rhamnogalacturonan endolyase